MSYDLFIYADESQVSPNLLQKAKQKIHKLENADYFEVYAFDGKNGLIASASLSGDDKIVSTFWVSLIKLCKEEQWNIQDSNIGEFVDLSNAGKFPVGWTPKSDEIEQIEKAYKSKIKDLLETGLIQKGFEIEHGSDTLIKRSIEPIFQSIDFGFKESSGKIYLIITQQCKTEHGIAGGHFKTMEYDCRNGQFYYAFEKIESQIFENIIPLFDKIATVEKFVKEFDTDNEAIKDLFGFSEQIRLRNIARCNSYLGKMENAHKSICDYLLLLSAEELHKAAESITFFNKTRPQLNTFKLDWKCDPEIEYYFNILEYDYKEVTKNVTPSEIRKIMEDVLESKPLWIIKAINWINQGFPINEQYVKLVNNSRSLRITSQKLRSKMLKIIQKNEKQSSHKN